jgi:hypothetical protein
MLLQLRRAAATSCSSSAHTTAGHTVRQRQQQQQQYGARHHSTAAAAWCDLKYAQSMCRNAMPAVAPSSMCTPALLPATATCQCQVSTLLLLYCWIHWGLMLLPTADDRGRLVKATRLKGIKDFKATQFGLHPIALDVWGHFVFLHLQGGKPAAAAAAARHEGDPNQQQQQQQAAALSVGEWLGECWLSSSCAMAAVAEATV